MIKQISTDYIAVDLIVNDNRIATWYFSDHSIIYKVFSEYIVFNGVL
jgi:hypothetical protein